ncbi:hypothetical protein [Kalamiella sp. sgz302252]|uniref:hypothetical protein n=1 Tax=Pantoea sp. sgz302252 TaxID=3341827 RepID=UPI0036D35C6D
MEKERFLTRLGKWPNIEFTEVCITLCGNSEDSRSELYVRDRDDPPRWLFIRRLAVSEQPERILASYNLWLAEFNNRRLPTFCRSPFFAGIN